MSKNRLYVSGLWIIPGNAKRSRQYYLDLLPKTFELLEGQDLAFYCDSEDVKSSVIELSKRFHVNLFLRHLCIEDHTDYDLGKRIATNIDLRNFHTWSQAFQGLKTHEKALDQSKFLIASSHATYSTVITCNIGKISIILDALNKSEHDEYIWVDASVARFKLKRMGDFRRWKIPNGQLIHYASPMANFAKRQPALGAVLGAKRDTWPRIAKIYRSILQQWEITKCPHPVTDEVILAICKRKEPKLFFCTNPTRTLTHKIIGKVIWMLGLTSFLPRSLKL